MKRRPYRKPYRAPNAEAPPPAAVMNRLGRKAMKQANRREQRERMAEHKSRLRCPYCGGEGQGNGAMCSGCTAAMMEGEGEPQS